MAEDDSQKTGISRRDFLKSGVHLAGAFGVATQSSWLAAKGYNKNLMHLEKSELSLGFVPLTDCASLVLAKELGIFKKNGLNVKLQKQSSWSNIRDRVTIGNLDGAQMLATMPLASTLGIGTIQKPMQAAFIMALNGNAITISHELYARMLELDPEAMKESPITARALKKVIDMDRKAGRDPMTFATVFPTSTHNYELRYWMAAAGINPDEDIRLVVISPEYMVSNLEAQNIVGYCVGEPWNQLAVKAGVGRVLTTKYQIWNNSPEKVFAVTNSWAEKNPNTYQALLISLMEASDWIEHSDNRSEVANILANKEYVNAPLDVIKMSMTGTYQYARHLPAESFPDFNVFNRYVANFPWQSHAEWFLTQMYRWGDIQIPINIKETAALVYRTDLYAKAATEIGLTYPASTHKKEGVHKTSWTLDETGKAIQMGADVFFDRQVFDSEKIVEYIYDFNVHSNVVTRNKLEEFNA
ncbi:MAG: CmpA/NrtA family ABC transporter substrate-binding protein [Pseudomonadota bacterium]